MVATLFFNPKEKADVFNRYFASQACITGSDTAIVSSLVRCNWPILSSILADEILVDNLPSTLPRPVAVIGYKQQNN